MAVAVLAAFSFAPPASAHSTWCGGLGPTSTQCTSASHTVAGYISHGPWLEHSQNFTGTMESRLDYSGGARIFRCDIKNGILDRCKRQGEFPATGVVFTHSCRTYVLGTTTAGGVGYWECRVISH